MWHGMRLVWISSRHTGQLECETFSIHCKIKLTYCSAIIISNSLLAILSLCMSRIYFYYTYTISLSYAYCMPILQLYRQTHVALSTMKESIAATNSTYTTSIAMILILVLVVEKITLQTGVLPKLTVAILAGGLDRLASVAQNTYQLCHLLPVHCMCFLLVVTKPASVHLIAARSLHTKEQR